MPSGPYTGASVPVGNPLEPAVATAELQPCCEVHKLGNAVFTCCDKCPTFFGKPATAAHRSVCQRCGGLGYLVSGNGGPGAQSLRTCLDCDGTGEVTEDA